MEHNRNFFLTIGLSVAILVLWQVFYMNPRVDAQREAARIKAEQALTLKAQSGQSQTSSDGGVVASNSGETSAPDGSEGEGAIEAGRIAIDTPVLAGSINLRGARLDDLLLKNYHVDVSKSSDLIKLLQPTSTDKAYFAEIGYAKKEGAGSLPGRDTIWKGDTGATLTPTTPVTLTYTNEKGLTFNRTISVDENYMFSITDRVENASQGDVLLSPYGRVARHSKPTTQSVWVLHEGLIGVTREENLQEITYSSIEDDKRVSPKETPDGWLGITDKYWAVVLIPQGEHDFQERFSYFEKDGGRYQADFLTDPQIAPAGGTLEVNTLLFAGAKEVDVINNYAEQKKIRLFDRLIDWGWFPYLTKPLFWLLDHLYGFFGNFGLAILATTVIVKAVFFPLANKSYTSMAKMKNLQPAIAEMREKYPDDRAKQQQAMMEMYKKEKVNPVAGCWPVLLQIPVFFSLYKVLYITIEMRHAPFFGWIKDLAAPDPTSIFNLFGLIPFDPPQFLMVGVWPLIMGITMFLQMRMNPTPPDPTQAMIFTWMPVVFTFMLAAFPAGLVIYWAWNNTLSIIQQGVIMKRSGAKIELWDNLMALFSKKKGKDKAGT